MTETRKKVLAIVGPTCTGKTALSLFLGRHIPAEIICCDSRNIYKYFDIGSAKPSQAERQEIRHHLIDLAEANENFTAAQFAQAGQQAINEIHSRSRLPIVCGGTGFYARALLEGLSIPEVAPQQELRETLKRKEEAEPGYLHQQLKQLDPKTAERLNPRDVFRLIRALEVCMVTGKPFSQLAQVEQAPYDVLWIGLNIRDREKLKVLISRRLQEQMAAGMLAEVEDLCRRYGSTEKMRNTVNYRDLLKYLSGELSLEEALHEAEKHNYQLARRQMMWFKNNPNICWFYVDEVSREEIELQVLEMLRQFVS